MTNYICCYKCTNKKSENQIFVIKYYKKRHMQQFYYNPVTLFAFFFTLNVPVHLKSPEFNICNPILSTIPVTSALPMRKAHRMSEEPEV